MRVNSTGVAQFIQPDYAILGGVDATDAAFERKGITHMAQHQSTLVWERGEQTFVDGLYSRNYVLRFDGGIELQGSPSPHIVRPPMSDPAAVDPEEMFVASLSACHMLWFLAIAAKRGYRIDRYHDEAAGVLGKNAEGRLAMAQVRLRPKADFSGDLLPTREEIERMHHEAHEECFIANSVKTKITCEPLE